MTEQLPVRCDACRWWQRSPRPASDCGECHGGVPAPLVAPQQRAGPTEEFLWARWPLTMADDCCRGWTPPAAKQTGEGA